MYNAMRTFIARMSALLVLVLAVWGLFQPAQAQLQKIEQTVFGMDCAPCAHAMEQGIGSMEGVEAVSVNLNDGLATIDLSNTNEVAYRDIRKAISNGGFSAKKATLEAQGMLRQKGDQWILETPAGEQFVLRPGKKASSGEDRLQDLKPDRQVIVTGQIPASLNTKDTLWPLRVQRVRSAT